MKTAVIPSILLALSLAACAGNAEASSTAATTSATSSVSPSPSSSATPTAASLPPVSLETTCSFLYGSKMDGLLNKDTDIITRFVAHPDLSTIKLSEVQETADSLESASNQASPELRPYIEAQRAPLLTLADSLQNGKNNSLNFTDWKAAGIELINRCKPYVG